jgi:hypothetical protein
MMGRDPRPSFSPCGPRSCGCFDPEGASISPLCPSNSSTKTDRLGQNKLRNAILAWTRLKTTAALHETCHSLENTSQLPTRTNSDRRLPTSPPAHGYSEYLDIQPACVLILVSTFCSSFSKSLINCHKRQHRWVGNCFRNLQSCLRTLCLLLFSADNLSSILESHILLSLLNPQTNKTDLHDTVYKVNYVYVQI